MIFLFYFCAFFPACLWRVSHWALLWIMNHFNSLQSASRGHSQHSVQTDGPHSQVNSRTHDSCPLLSKGGWVSFLSGGGGKWKYKRWMQPEQRGDVRDGGEISQNISYKVEKDGEWLEKRGNDRRKKRKDATTLMMPRLILFVPVYSHQLCSAHNHCFWLRQRETLVRNWNWHSFSFPCEEWRVEFSFLPSL